MHAQVDSVLSAKAFLDEQQCCVTKKCNATVDATAVFLRASKLKKLSDQKRQEYIYDELSILAEKQPGDDNFTIVIRQVRGIRGGTGQTVDQNRGTWVSVLMILG